MNSKLLLPIIFLAAFSSCTSVYKSGQTPDDVYFSPGRGGVAEARQEVRQQTRPEDKDEAQIRMGINNPRWRYFDNDISYNPYQYGYNYGYYYNPYYCTYPVYNNVVFVTTNPKNTTPRMANLGGYGNGYSNANSAFNTKTGGTYVPARSYNNINRRVNQNSNTNYQNSNTTDNNRTYNTPTNTNTNSTSTPSSSGSTSGSSGTVTRPARGKG